MGLTIHYSLQSGTRSPKKARELIVQLHRRALDLPFAQVGPIVELVGPDCGFENRGREDPLRWLLIQAGQFVDDPRHQGYSYSVNPTHIIAFSTWPGEGCEEANFGLCRYAQRTGKPSERLLQNLRRDYFGLVLYPLPWVSHHWQQAVAVFADLERFPRRQVFPLQDVPRDLIGFQEATEFDFFSSRFRQRRRNKARCPVLAAG